MHYNLTSDESYFSVNFRDIKEVRRGKSSKDFDKWSEDARRVDQKLCFVVYYGNDFKLHTLSVVGKSQPYISVFIPITWCVNLLVQVLCTNVVLITF